jgi:hypothetical protein
VSSSRIRFIKIRDHRQRDDEKIEDICEYSPLGDMQGMFFDFISPMYHE